MSASAVADDPLLPGFVSMSWLWEGENPPYPSEYAARWAVRQMREDLLTCAALMVRRKQTLVHRERFTQVVQARALQAALKRYGPKS